METRAVPTGRVDIESGVYRAVYHVAPDTPVLASADATARAYLEAEKELFGWSSTDVLRLDNEHAARYSTHLTYRQLIDGIPVYNRFVKVSLDAAGKPVMIISGFATGLDRTAPFSHRPRISRENATRQAIELLAAGEVLHAELIVYPSNEPLLAWSLIVGTGTGEWDVLIGAETGAPILILDRLLRRHSVDGSGLVFDPDPITSAGTTYSGPYRDLEDADNQELNAERQEVVLRDITQGADGLYRLEGPHVVIRGSGGFVPPAEADPHGFRYTRSNDAFEAVMVYYHIDASYRYIKLMELGMPEPGRVLRAEPHGFGNADNSAFFPAEFALRFGDGGVDDAEDAEVIIHELGHALLETHAPTLGSDSEVRAFHEGWSDYWATSYTRGLMDQDIVPPHDWRHVMTWDAGEFWPGRHLSIYGRYGEVTRCHTGGCPPVFWYHDGLFWATAAMDIYTAVGKDVTDRLAVYSQLYLSAPFKMPDAAEAVIKADEALFEGQHVPVLSEIFLTRNLIDPSRASPVLAHTQPTLDDPDATQLELRLTATASGSAIRVARVSYRFDNSPLRSVELNQIGADIWAITLPLIPNSARLFYYFDVVDDLGRASFLPLGAPESEFLLEIIEGGIPVITHQGPLFVSIEDGPPEVRANVTPSNDVGGVWVLFEAGESRTPGRFELSAEGSAFAGYFPTDILAPETKLYYRIYAEAAAPPLRTATFPEEDQPPLDIDIGIGGALLSIDFERGRHMIPGDGWVRETPVYGLRTAHSGVGTWVTNPAGPYPDTPGRRPLDWHAGNFSKYNLLWLEFWHWYDFELEPGSLDRARDGGNVKISFDGGVSWRPLVPQEDYDAIVSPTRGNPMVNEPVYGGYSYGWRRVRMPFSGGDDTRFRFEFGTDTGNDGPTRHGYTGWAIDDVRVLVQQRPDNTPPEASGLPDALVIASAGNPPPPFVVRARDDTGIRHATVSYQYQGFRGETTEGTLPLEMTVHSLTEFSAALPLPRPMARGDIILYRYHLADYDNNLVIYPPDGESPYVLESHLVEATSLLATAVQTGHWQGASNQFSATPTEQPGASGLILGPVDIPENAAYSTFVLTQSYQLTSATGGNVKVRSTSASRWQLLRPREEYTAEAPAGHPLEREPMWQGTQHSDTKSRFDLGQFAGGQVWLRLDFGVSRGATLDDYWLVRDAIVESSTLDPSLDVSRELALHPNFPDPFADHTAVQFTLEEAAPVRVEVYNVLGQRVQILADRAHAAGSHTLHFKRQSLAAGLYFVRLTTGGRQLLEPMVIGR